MLIVNLVDQREAEKRVGDEYRNLFDLLVRTYQSKQKKDKSLLGYMTEKDFIWFDYHEQARAVKNLTPEQFVEKFLIKSAQYNLTQELERHGLFTYHDGTVASRQKGVFRINCIDCLDRTNNVQLAIGLYMSNVQIDSLKRHINTPNLEEHLRDMWINNGDHISRIYTGTGALGQRNKVNTRVTSFVDARVRL